VNAKRSRENNPANRRISASLSSGLILRPAASSTITVEEDLLAFAGVEGGERLLIERGEDVGVLLVVASGNSCEVRSAAGRSE
jgi:hypothetical protein